MLLARRHARSVLWPLLLAALLIIVPFFFLFTLVRAGTFGMALFSLLLAIGVAFAIRVFLIWDSYVLLLTNQRIVHVEQRGVWRRLVREMPLFSIQQAHVEKRGLFDALLKTGSLHLRSNGHGVIHFPRLHRPDAFIRLIDSVRDPKIINEGTSSLESKEFSGKI